MSEPLNVFILFFSCVVAFALQEYFLCDELTPNAVRPVALELFFLKLPECAEAGSQIKHCLFECIFVTGRLCCAYWLVTRQYFVCFRLHW